MRQPPRIAVVIGILESIVLLGRLQAPQRTGGPEEALLLRGERGGQMVTRLPSATCLLTVYYYGSSAIASGDEDQALLGDAHYHTAAEGHGNKRAVRP